MEYVKKNIFLMLLKLNFLIFFKLLLGKTKKDYFFLSKFFQNILNKEMKLTKNINCKIKKENDPIEGIN